MPASASRSPVPRALPPVRALGRRAAVLVALVFIALWLPARSARADSPAAPLRMTRDSVADLFPQVAVDSDGTVQVVWLRRAADGGATSLQGTILPEGVAHVLAALAPSPASLGAPAFLLDRGSRSWLVWPQPVSGNISLQVRNLDTGEDSVYLLAARPLAWAYTVDDAGRPHAAWSEGNTITYWTPEQPSGLVVPVPSSARTGEVAIAMAADGHAWLAWTSWGADGRRLGVYVVDPLEAGTPILVAPDGRAPRLLSTAAGQIALFWTAPDGLRVASADDWQAQSLVTVHLADGAALALAADSNGRMFAAWQADGRLWLADSTSWIASRRAVVETTTPFRGLALAADPGGRAYLVWSADADESEEICYLRVDPPTARLSIVSPRGGDDLSTLNVPARAEVIANGALPLVEVSFWSEERPTDAALGGLLTRLGTDADGSDGWSAPDGARLSASGTWRVLAFGTDADGRQIRALGEWFTARDEDAPLVLLDGPETDVVRGRGMLSVLALSPTADEIASAFTLLSHENGVAVLMGARTTEASPDSSSPGWESVPFDSRTLADGEWQAEVSAADASGRRTVAVLGTPLIVDNAMPPRVMLQSPLGGQAITGTLSVRALADDPDGRVERVEFYVARNAPSVTALPADESEVPAQALWLGSDVDGGDGWSAERPIDEELDGDDWVAWAVAYDDHGLATTVRTDGAFALAASDRPVARLVIPSPGSVLRGVRPVALHVVAGTPGLGAVRLYAIDASGAATNLGEFREVDGRWLAEWDTTPLPDGEYRLLAVGEDSAGRTLRAVGGPVQLANQSTALRFRTPEEEAEVTGLTMVRWEPWPDGAALQAVRLYRRGADGALALLGEDLSAEGGWAVLWDTRYTLDGACDLVAIGWGAAGPAVRAERHLVVRNVSPAVSDLTVEPGPDGAAGEPLRGEVSVRWQASHPSGQPLSARLEFSPLSAGSGVAGPWVLVATDLPGSGEYTWDTRLSPDARAGLLRITVSDGLHDSALTSAPLAIDNANEAPQVALVAPAAGQALSGATRLVWQAADPDGDPVRSRVEFRSGEGNWTVLADGEEATAGSYLWDTDGLEAGSSVALRVTAVDPSGAEGSDAVTGLTAVRNTPPVVRLLAPRGESPLRGEAVVLWETADAEEDSLRVDLYASDDSGQTWLPIVENLADTGYYVWQFSFLPSGSAYRLRIVARDAYASGADQSGLLVIDPAPAPAVVLHDPSAGQEVHGEFPVSWSVFPLGSGERSIRIAVRGDGADWQPVAEDLDDSGLYLWDTTTLPDGEYDLAVRAQVDRGGEVESAPRRVVVRNEGPALPSVRLQMPQGGEVWGGLREVRWEVQGGSAELSANLQVSADGGWNWDSLSEVDARAGTWLWDTASLPDGDRYLLQLEILDEDVRVADRSAGAFRLANAQNTPPEAWFRSPNAEGAFADGSSARWQAEDADGDAVAVALDLSEDGGQSWRTLAGDLPATGEYPLPDLAAGPAYRLRLRASDGRYEVGVQSAALELPAAPEGKPMLSIEAPKAGDSWAGVQEVRWTANEPGAREVAIDVALSADGGREWVPLVEGFPNTGVYDVDTTAFANGTWLLRVTAHLAAQASAQTSAPFRIDNPSGNAPVVSLVAPIGGETWSGAREVHWVVRDADGDAVSTELFTSVDDGATWEALAALPAGTDSYIWDTTSVPNCRRVLLRVQASDGRFASHDTLARPLAVANPSVPRITLQVPAGQVWTGLQRLSWVTRESPGPEARVVLEWSVEEGRTWRTLADGLPPTGSMLWDSDAIADGAQVLLRARLLADQDLAIDMAETPAQVLGNNGPAED